MNKKKLFAIIGSTRRQSSGRNIVNQLAKMADDFFEVTIFEELDQLPHFNPDLDFDDPPAIISRFRLAIQEADLVVICTPEYVFSLPGSLKNAIEWCVSTTVFSGKPTGLIVAAASGEKAKEELELAMQTLEAKIAPETTLLIKGAQGKLNSSGEIIHQQLKIDLTSIAYSLIHLLEK